MIIEPQEQIKHPSRIALGLLWRIWLFWALLWIPAGVLFAWFVVALAMGSLGVEDTEPVLVWFAIGRALVYCATSYLATWFGLRYTHGKRAGKSFFYLADFTVAGAALSRNPASMGKVTWAVFARYALPVLLLELIVTIAICAVVGQSFFSALGFFGLSPLAGDNFMQAFTIAAAATLLTFAANLVALRWVLISQNRKDFGGSTFFVANHPQQSSSIS